MYLKAGGERDKTAVLVALGVDEQGHVELLAMDEGYRESTAAWAEAPNRQECERRRDT